MTTIQTSNLLTPEEFASLLELAVTIPEATIAGSHLKKLIELGLVLETPRGLRVTGDGLIRITETE